MRCFIALDMPEAIKDSIGAIIEKIMVSARGVRWVPPLNLHMTLKFLGEVNEESVPAIKAALSEVAVRSAPFSVTVRGAGAFPNPKHPNILWIGMEGPEELKMLYRGIDDAMSGLGFKRENRDFSPHITIGRVKDKKGIEPVIKELDNFRDASFGSVEVREVLLMKSELKQAGAEYSKVAVFKLSGL